MTKKKYLDEAPIINSAPSKEVKDLDISDYGGTKILKEVTVYPGNIRARKVNDYNYRHGIGLRYKADSKNESIVYDPIRTMYAKDKPLEIVSPEFDLLALGLPTKLVSHTTTQLTKGAERLTNGALYDSYTTLGGRLGYYSKNPIVNTYATLARRFNLPDKARLPSDYIRKIKEIPRSIGRKIDLTGNKNFLGKPHVNGTIDRPVVSHNKGGWDGADTYISSFPEFIKDFNFNGLRSIEPSDVFGNGLKLTRNNKDVVLISGDVEALNWARSKGIQTLSSPKLRSIYQNKAKSLKADISEPNKIRGINLQKQTDVKHKDFFPEYAKEVQRLQSQRGTPTLKDFRLLEQITGKKAGVASIEEKDNAIRILSNLKGYTDPDEVAFLVNNGISPKYIFPNGRAVSLENIRNIDKEINLIKRMPYNKVFYDPASHVESNWRTNLGI